MNRSSHPGKALASSQTRHVSNLTGWDYAAEARRLTQWPFPIIDVHTHLVGAQAARVFSRAAELYGVRCVYSMTPLEEVDGVAAVLGEAVRFIAIPDIFAQDRWHALTDGYADRIRRFHEKGARIAKFWSAPRGVDFAEQAGAPAWAFRLDAPHVQRNLATAVDLGMTIMVHVADPDTWFATHYADASRYGTKAQQYQPLEMCLRRFPAPFIAAHMGGWPENLEFLGQLLEQHDNLYLDTSATKWMVRELSQHPRTALVEFLSRWTGRILFGSDIVTRDAHLANESADPEEAKAGSPHEAFDLYASRYWALRTLFESDFDGPSPIADPDLHLVAPDRFDEHDAPRLKGFSVPSHVLRSIYCDTPQQLLGDVRQ